MKIFGFNLNWRNLEDWKKSVIIASLIGLISNSIFYYIPHSQVPAIVVPFSATEYVTLASHSFGFPIEHFIYSSLFIMIILGIFAGAITYLYRNTNKLTQTTGLGAIGLIFIVLLLTFVSPMSPFSVIPQYTHLNIHVQSKNTGQPVVNSLCYLYVGNIYQGSKRTNTYGNVKFSQILSGRLFQGGCYSPSSSKISKKFGGTTWTTTGITVELEGVNTCFDGQMKCLAGSSYKCVTGVWEQYKECSSDEICVSESSTNAYCKKQQCGTDGWHCIDQWTNGNCQNGIWTDKINCEAGCSNGVCKSTCDSRWKCKDSITLGYQRSDCSWKNLNSCAPEVCIDTGDTAHCSSVTTTTLPPTSTCNKQCNAYNYDWGACVNQPIGEKHLLGDFCGGDLDCWCGNSVTSTTTTTPSVTSTTILPPPPSPDYTLYGGITVILFLFGILGYVIYTKRK